MNVVIDAYVSEFSGNFSAAILVWPLLSLLISLPFLIYLYRRDGWLHLTTTLAIYASVLYAAGLVCFTLYPLPSGNSGPGITYGIEPILNPLNFIDDVSRNGLHAAFQLLFNIVLFVPLGFIARTLLKLEVLPTLAISFGATCLIETAQLTGLFGTYPFAFRTFDVDDIICNTLGGLLGWGLGLLAVRLVMDESAQRPPITHSPGFVRRCVTLWTDALIINVCVVVPRILIAVALRMLFGSSLDADSLLLERINQAAMVVLFVISFAIVEVVVPWRNDGSTPSGMFYRMSCETRERAGRNRVAFYALRTVTILLVLVFPKYAALPLALFFLFARKMPYDFMPASADVGAASPNAGVGMASATRRANMSSSVGAAIGRGDRQGRWD